MGKLQLRRSDFDRSDAFLFLCLFHLRRGTSCQQIAVRHRDANRPPCSVWLWRWRFACAKRRNAPAPWHRCSMARRERLQQRARGQLRGCEERETQPATHSPVRPRFTTRVPPSTVPSKANPQRTPFADVASFPASISAPCHSPQAHVAVT